MAVMLPNGASSPGCTGVIDGNGTVGKTSVGVADGVVVSLGRSNAVLLGGAEGFLVGGAGCAVIVLVAVAITGTPACVGTVVGSSVGDKVTLGVGVAFCPLTLAVSFG